MNKKSRTCKRRRLTSVKKLWTHMKNGEKIGMAVSIYYSKNNIDDYIRKDGVCIVYTIARRHIMNSVEIKRKTLLVIPMGSKRDEFNSSKSCGTPLPINFQQWRSSFTIDWSNPTPSEGWCIPDNSSKEVDCYDMELWKNMWRGLQILNVHYIITEINSAVNNSH